MPKQNFAKEKQRQQRRANRPSLDLPEEQHNGECRASGCRQPVKYSGYCSAKCLDQSVPLTERKDISSRPPTMPPPAPVYQRPTKPPPPRSQNVPLRRKPLRWADDDPRRPPPLDPAERVYPNPHNVTAPFTQQEIRDVRIRLGLSQKRLAYRLGCSRSKIAECEHGRRTGEKTRRFITDGLRQIAEQQGAQKSES